MRVLVVDDSAFMRTAITRMVTEHPELEVIDTARNGQDAIEKVRRLEPDLVTLDIEMPVMSGLEALPEILRAEPGKKPPAVLMCSSLTTKGSMEALQALRLGAADVIAKDCSFASAQITEIKDQLISKLVAIGSGRGARTRSQRSGVAVTDRPVRVAPAEIDLVLIGSSTGGPPVLEEIVSSLPPDLSVPVVIAQHMPAIFTKSMAQRLDEQSALTVVHADATMPLLPGCVFVIQGGTHGKIKKAGVRRFSLSIESEPATALYKPSVNELFSSAADTVRGRGLAVVLTGMGDDGSIGATRLRDAGGRVLAQNAESCVVYGMPRAVTESGVAEASMPPSALAMTLAQLRTSQTTAGRIAG